MDPLTSIVMALAAGATAGIEPTVAQAVKDAYAGLKALIMRKYANVNVELLAQSPTSDTCRQVVKEDLASVAAEKDEELLHLAKILLDAVQHSAPAVIGAIGVSLEDIRGASLTIEDVMATGTGVKASRVEVSGDLRIRGVRAGGSDENPPKVQGQ